MSDSAIYCLECIDRNFAFHEKIQNETLDMICNNSRDKSMEFRDKFQNIGRRLIMKVLVEKCGFN